MGQGCLNLFCSVPCGALAESWLCQDAGCVDLAMSRDQPASYFVSPGSLRGRGLAVHPSKKMLMNCQENLRRKIKTRQPASRVRTQGRSDLHSDDSHTNLDQSGGSDTQLFLQTSQLTRPRHSCLWVVLSYSADRGLDVYAVTLLPCQSSSGI